MLAAPGIAVTFALGGLGVAGVSGTQESTTAVCPGLEYLQPEHHCRR